MTVQKKMENAAFFLPFLGVALVVPPILSVFSVATKIFGIPLLVVYIFTVWLGLIGVTFFLSKRMVTGSDATTENENGDADP